MDEPTWIASMMYGITGALIYTIVQRYVWVDKYYIYRRLVFGATVGYIMFLFEVYIDKHTDLTASIAGSYMILDVLESALYKLHLKKEAGKGGKKQ